MLIHHSESGSDDDMFPIFQILVWLSVCSSVYGVFNCSCVFVIEWTFCCRVILSVLLVVISLSLVVLGDGMNTEYSSFLSVQVIISFCLKSGLVSMYVCNVVYCKWIDVLQPLELVLDDSWLSVSLIIIFILSGIEDAMYLFNKVNLRGFCNRNIVLKVWVI